MILQVLGMGFGMALLNPAVQESLGLSDAQREKVEELVSEHHSKVVDLRAQLAKKRFELRLALKDGDEAKAKKLAAEVGSLQSKLLQERTEFQIKLRKLLGDEKFEKLMRMRGRRGKGCHRGRHGPPPGPPPGPEM